MARGKQLEMISLVDFIGEVDGSLSLATDPTKPLPQSVEAADSVLTRLAAVKAGNLAVHPPISEAQISFYKDKSQTILAIGAKASAGLSQAEEGRSRLGKRVKTDKSSPRYTGRGSAAKI